MGCAGLLGGPVTTACAISGPAATPHVTGRGTSAAAAVDGRFSEVWTRQVPAQFAQGSPNVATLQGSPAVVVGGLDGRVYAFGLGHGLTVSGWPAMDPGAAPIQSTPSVNGSIVYVGTGDAGHPFGGGYLALNSDGTQRWYHTVPVLPIGGQIAGVQASLTVGRLQGTRSVIAGSLGQLESAYSASTGTRMSGFPWFAADSEFSTPSVVNLYGTGRDYIVEGGESTAGNSYGVGYENGVISVC